jgi:hypothetical protein
VKDEVRDFLSRDPARKQRARAFLSSLDEPDAELDDLMFDARFAYEGSPAASQAASLLLLRLSGPSIGRGWLSHDLNSSVVAPFLRQIDSATPARARSGDGSSLGLVGVSAGSVVLHLRPARTDWQPDASQLAFDVSPVDAAVARVSMLHDKLERRAPAADISRHFANDVPLLRQSRLLNSNLFKRNITLSTVWWGADSQRSVTRLSSKGQRHALNIFETEMRIDDEVVTGMVTGLDIEGRVVLTPRSGKHRYKVSMTPQQVRSASFTLGNTVSLVVQQESDVDRVGMAVSRPRYKFVRHVDEPTLEM